MTWLDDFTDYAQDLLGDREREALWARGVSDDQIDLYKVGYIEAEIPELEYPKSFSSWWKKHSWKMKDIYILPLTTTLGEIQGIQVRNVDEGIKGYNDYLAVKDEAVLFGLSQAMSHVWETGSICLVEGGFDLFPMQRHIPYVVSTLHAGVSSSFLRILKRLVRQVYMAYDNDSAGRSVAYKFKREHRDTFEAIEVLEFPKVPFKDRHIKDPGELWQVWGDKRLGVYLRRLTDPYHQMET